MSAHKRAYRGEILIYRDDVLFADYGDTLTTSLEFGSALKSAITALEAGDTLVIGPGIYDTYNCTISVANVKVYGEGAIIQRLPATNYTHLLKVDADDCIIQGVACNGAGASNTGTGYGIWVTGDRVQLKNVSAEQTRGTTADSGDGSTVKIDNCTDTLIDGLYSYDAGYTGLWLNKTTRAFISNVRVVDAVNRSLSINSTFDIDLITVTNFNAIALTEGCSSTWNTNIDETFTLGELRMTNVHLVDTDMVSAGVSYQDASHQMMKFQNIDRLYMKGCTFTHGSAIGGGGYVARTIYLQAEEGVGETNTPPDLWVMEDCTFDSVIGCELKLPKLIAKNCTFGRRDYNDYSELFYRLRCSFASFDGCTFDSQSKTQIFELGEDTNLADRYVFKNNTFLSNSASSTYIMNQTDDEDLTTMAGCFICDATNTIDNVGAGTMYKTNNPHGNLLLNTNANGDMLFDDTAIATNEIQRFHITGATPGGTFTVTYSGATTSGIAWNANAATVKAALEALSTIDLVAVTGAGTSGDPWIIEFQGKLNGVDLASNALTLSGAGLTGDGAVSSVTTNQSPTHLGRYPDPTAGPAYFPGLDANANGIRIWNINWTPDATQVVPEKGWISHNGAWVEMT